MSKYDNDNMIMSQAIARMRIILIHIKCGKNGSNNNNSNDNHNSNDASNDNDNIINDEDGIKERYL